jgi:hypothetical protein
MRCVAISESGAVVDVQPQPSDFTGCSLVLVAGDQSGPFAVPTPEQVASVFEWSCSLVLFFGLAGFLIGRVVNLWSFK